MKGFDARTPGGGEQQQEEKVLADVASAKAAHKSVALTIDVT